MSGLILHTLTYLVSGTYVRILTRKYLVPGITLDGNIRNGYKVNVTSKRSLRFRPSGIQHDSIINNRHLQSGYQVPGTLVPGTFFRGPTTFNNTFNNTLNKCATSLSRWWY